MNNDHHDRPSVYRDAFDATVSALEGQQDATKTSPATKRVLHPIINTAMTYIVQTYRTELGDTVLVECIEAGRTLRVALPPDVSDIILRQHDAVTTKNRRRGASKAIETRAANCETCRYGTGEHTCAVAALKKARKKRGR